jgi:predicted site-specific integrase-resolvase
MIRLCEFIRQAGVAKSTVWLWARQGKVRTYKVNRAVFIDEDFPTFCRRMERERQEALAAAE